MLRGAGFCASFAIGRYVDGVGTSRSALLAARFDTFAKYEFYSAVLQDAGHNWESLQDSKDMFCELALLDQSYHEFCNPTSVFARLESAELLQHRVGPQVLPGAEAEPFVPETSTRARVRAVYQSTPRSIRTAGRLVGSTTSRRTQAASCSTPSLVS